MDEVKLNPNYKGNRNLVGLGQISWLRDKMLNSEHFKIYDLNYHDFNRIWETKTHKQYGYFLWLVGEKKYFEAKKLLDQFGFQHLPEATGRP
jgi:hypothetical protein